MNISEGVRRLGILLGAAGALLGGFLASGDATEVWSMITAHRKFEVALALPTVQRVAKSVVTGDLGHAVASSDPGPATQPKILSLQDLAKFGTDTGSRPEPSLVETRDPTGGITIWEGNSLLKGNRDGIDGVYFDSAKRVTQIRFATGDWVFRTELPMFKAYLLVLAFPVVGFLIPWASIRLLAWVGTGFFAPRSP